MSVKCRDIINILNKLAPPKYAENWDNIGLQIGDPDALVKKVMVSLDATLPVVESAVEKQVDMLIVHHTPMFKPVNNILWNTPQGKIIQQLIKANISLYCAHTNLDSAPKGVNDILAEMLNLNNIEVLSPTWQEQYVKLVVFVPHGYEDAVRDALARKGAGWLGNYSDCTFQIAGVGTFRPLEGTNPFIGERDKLEKVEEYRVETILPKHLVQNAVKAMLAAHPYEEVAYDLYPLVNKGESIGLGRVGLLPKEMPFQELLDTLGEKLNVENLKYVGDLNQKVKKVALCGGSGASLIKQALAHQADVFVTGDLKYHEAQESESLGLFLVDAGHFATEYPVVAKVAEFLQENLNADVEILACQINTNPFRFYTR